ncbi:maintenance of telomere capping protein 1 [Mycena filopes]|nr:maintenance of telomere capping protein 1 [Mycena filopes]
MSKSKQEEALAFLDDLDSFTPPPTDGAPCPCPCPRVQQAARQKSSPSSTRSRRRAQNPPRARPTSTAPHPAPGTPTVRKSTERVRLGGGAPSASLLRTPSSSSLRKDAAQPAPEPTSASASSAGGGGWGWGTVWSSCVRSDSAGKVLRWTSRSSTSPRTEQARKWGEGMIEYAKTAQLDKLGQDFKRVGLSTLTDILNVVAPPISEHEVIQVWLSHDMRGYEGIESLVYRALARIMEQVEGGDLIVNRGEESRPKESANSDTPRDLNAVEGYEAAVKLAQANLDELIKNNTKVPPANPDSSNLQTPTTYSHIYLRIQPFLTSFPFPATTTTEDAPPAPAQHLQFLVSLSDPSHKLTHNTVTQCVPGDWLAAGMWERYEWVEDLMAEALRVGVEVIGQEYVVKRMGWGAEVKETAVEAKSEEVAKNASAAEESTVGEPGELVEKPKLGEET